MTKKNERVLNDKKSLQNKSLKKIESMTHKKCHYFTKNGNIDICTLFIDTIWTNCTFESSIKNYFFLIMYFIFAKGMYIHYSNILFIMFINIEDLYIIIEVVLNLLFNIYVIYCE